MQEQWGIFSQKEQQQLSSLNALEQCLLFGAGKMADLSAESLEERFGHLPFDLLNSLAAAASVKTPEFVQHVKPVSPFSTQRLTFFTLVFDLQLLVHFSRSSSHSVTRAMYTDNHGAHTGPPSLLILWTQIRPRSRSPSEPLILSR